MTTTMKAIRHTIEWSLTLKCGKHTGLVGWGKTLHLAEKDLRSKLKQRGFTIENYPN